MPPLSNLFAFLRPGKAVITDPAAELLQQERAARALAEEAVARLDLPAALAALRDWEHRAAEPVTLALLGHVLKTMGEPERAGKLLEATQRAHPHDLVVLETLAQYYEFVRDAAGEYRCRKQRLMLPDCTVAHVLDAMRVLISLRSAGAVPPAELRFVRAMFAQREPLARADENMRFAELSFAAGDMPEPSLKLMRRHSPAPAGLQDTVYARTAARNVPEGAGSYRAVGEGPDAAELLTLRDAWVVPGLHWSPCAPGARAVFDAFMTMQPRLAREAPASAMLLRSRTQIVLRLPVADPPVVQGPCVLLGGNGTSNYYHFMHEHLSRLGVLDALGIDHGGMRYVIGGGLQPFHHEFLALLGIGSDRLVLLPDEGALAFTELLAPLPLGRGGDFTNPLIARWARERLVPADLRTGAAGRKLFLSRARTGRRRIVNEAQVFEACAAHGYEMVYPEELSVREQIALFAQASHIAGSGGAALTNMLFMPPGGQVLMLNNRYIPAHARSLYFGPLTRACGHTFTILSGEPVAFPSDRAIDADVRIDVDELRRLLQAA